MFLSRIKGLLFRLSGFYKPSYLLLILEKGIKLLFSFIIIYLLKSKGLLQLLGVFAIIEMFSITLQTFSIFGTDVVLQRELHSGNNNELHVIRSGRIAITILLFTMSVIFINEIIDENFYLYERIIMCSFILLAPFQTFEQYLFSRDLFGTVYKLKIISYLISFIVKIGLLFYSPQLILFSIAFDYISLFSIYLLLSWKNNILSFRISQVKCFFERYFRQVIMIFIAAIVISVNNQVLFSIVKVKTSPEVIASLYIFLKMAEGFNFLSSNLALMMIPKRSFGDLFFQKELYQLIDSKKKYVLILMIVILIFFILVFKLYALSDVYIVAVSALLLFLINTYQIFIGTNFIFNKKGGLKLLMNISTLVLIIFSTYFLNYSSYLSVVYLLLASKFISIFVPLIKRNFE